MLSLILFVFAVFFTLCTLVYKNEWRTPKPVEILLSYILLLNMGLLGFLAAYAHVFMGPETAKLIGWEAGSPFQFEMGMANLSYGVLGILAFWIRGRFWDACIIGWSVLFLGCFVGHLIDYYTNNNTAPWNIGLYIWFTDLFLPLFVLATLTYLRIRPQTDRANRV